MNVIKLLLGTLDNLWSLWCILLIPVAGLVLVQFFPLPTLAFIGFMVHYQLLKADMLSKAYDFRGRENDDYLKGIIACNINAIILTVVTVVTYGYFIYWNISGGYLCKDYTDYIPGILPSLLQHFVTYSCPAA